MAVSLTNSKEYRKQIFIIGLFFFIFGFITWANGTLIPYLKMACDLQFQWQAYLVTFAFYISYTVMALPCGIILKKVGLLKGMQLGLITMAIGCFLFIPAANTRTYEIFLLGLFIIGTGLTILQSAVNPYVTVLGPIESASQRISIMGICNKAAGAIAPFIIGAIILQNADGLMNDLSVLKGEAKEMRLDELAQKVILPYSILGGILLMVGFLIRYSNLPQIKEESTASLSNTQNADGLSVFNYPALLFGFFAIFCSVAAEVIAGDTIGPYGVSQGYSLDVAKNFTSITLYSMIVGYVVGIIAIPKFISQGRAFSIYNILAIVLTVLVILLPGKTSVICLGLLGFSNALLWPAIWPAAIQGLPYKLLNIGSAILIMGIAGGAILPLLYGWLADLKNQQIAYIVLIPLYLFNLFYWFRFMRKQNAINS